MRRMIWYTPHVSWRTFNLFSGIDREYQWLNVPKYNELDSYESAHSILRLQRMYRIKTSDISTGTVIGHRSDALKWEDMFWFGNLAFDVKDFGLAAEWFQLANLAIRKTADIPKRKQTLSRLAKTHYNVSVCGIHSLGYWSSLVHCWLYLSQSYMHFRPHRL